MYKVIVFQKKESPVFNFFVTVGPLLLTGSVLVFIDILQEFMLGWDSLAQYVVSWYMNTY